MELIRRRAYARAGLIGNPSDGYHGRTLSVIVRNYFAQVVLYEWDELEVVRSQDDRSRFRSITELHHDVELHGYYGGVRLVKATIKCFAEYCQQTGRELHDRNFSIRYESNIPRAVGLAGSSGIIIATLRALLDFYQVEIPLRVLASLALHVENSELGIAGGLQDRVIQAYEGLVFMNFDKEHCETIDGFECGSYESLDPSLLPPLYVAFSREAGEPTEVTHAPLRSRYNNGDAAVVSAMTRFAELTDAAREALISGDHAEVSRLMDENYNLRASICDLSPTHVQMIETARRCGVSAKFAGSGGAIVGCLQPNTDFAALTAAMKQIDCEVFQPKINL
ncbi:MAG: mevalonate kinase family protein [Planctomycetota bacterium]|jgi:glucuronokinase